RQKIADIVRRRFFGGVLPFGRTSSIKGSQTDHAVSEKTDCIMLIINSYAIRSVIQGLTGPKAGMRLASDGMDAQCSPAQGISGHGT
ncbi:hypothetical protein, partial [Novacetimonas hansenii]|uniref:hypothetical protein n=1 Tax=Novacetimonas hansenii TaxID=436 RepID=UPI0038D1CE28